jgi:hypothetical protein
VFNHEATLTNRLKIVLIVAPSPCLSPRLGRGLREGLCQDKYGTLSNGPEFIFTIDVQKPRDYDPFA